MFDEFSRVFFFNFLAASNKVWRYAHYNSHTDISQKAKVLKATLKKLDSMASDDYVLCNSAMDKLREFRQLNYPPNMIGRMCNLMAATTRNTTWFQIKNSMVTTKMVPI